MIIARSGPILAALLMLGGCVTPQRPAPLPQGLPENELDD